MARIDVAVLGRPHVAVDGVIVPLGGRALALALRLALARHGPVPLHRLADVWPDSAASDGAIRVAVTRLRQSLGPDRVVRVDGGYLLAPNPYIDADRFEERLNRARDRSLPVSDRLTAIDDGLEAWRGPAYEGVERLAWIDFEAIRLDELRQHALDVRFELLVDRGDESVIGELTAAVSSAPERERRSELLAMALYRHGRQVEALDVIRTTSSRLRDERGLEPSAGVSELERRILTHDPTLLIPVVDPGTATRDPRLRSANALLREGDAIDALQIANQAVHAARRSGDRAALCRALLVSAQAAAMTDGEDANALIDEAKVVARSLDNGHLLARAALIRFGFGVPPDRTAAMIELGEPLDMLPADSPDRIELLCAAAVIVTFVDLDVAADRLLRAAERTHEAVGDARSEAVWLAARAIVSSVDGHHNADVAAIATRSYELATSVADAVLTTVTIHAVVRVAYERGELDRVDELADELEVVANRAALPFGVVRAHLCRATNAIARGQLEQATVHIDAAAEAGRRMNTHAAGPATRSLRFVVALERNELGPHLDVLRAIAAESDTFAAVAAAVGDDSDAVRFESRLETIGRDRLITATAAYASLAAARHGRPATARWARPHLEAIGERAVVVGFGSLVVGFGSLFLGLCDRALDDLDGACRHLREALVSAERVGAHLWAAHARLWLAETLLDMGGRAQEAEVASILVAASTDHFSPRSAAHAARLQGRLVAPSGSSGVSRGRDR